MHAAVDVIWWRVCGDDLHGLVAGICEVVFGTGRHNNHASGFNRKCFVVEHGVARSCMEIERLFGVRVYFFTHLAAGRNGHDDELRIAGEEYAAKIGMFVERLKRVCMVAHTISIARGSCYANGMLFSRVGIFLAVFVFMAAGCSWPWDSASPPVASPSSTPTHGTPLADEEAEGFSEVVYPVEGYTDRIIEKWFGKYVRDRFTGYHAGDDIEFTSSEDRARDIPVVAIADGEVVRVSRVDGYGGLIITRHVIRGRIVTALYGHIDLSSTDVQPGDLVTRGQFLANLGDHESVETDGERKHLHFGLYEGSDGRVNGYEATEVGLEQWMDPSAFLGQDGS